MCYSFQKANNKGNKEGKDQESIPSKTTPDSEHHMGKWQIFKRKKASYTKEPRGSRWPQGCKEQTRQHDRHETQITKRIHKRSTALERPVFFLLEGFNMFDGANLIRWVFTDWDNLEIICSQTMNPWCKQPSLETSSYSPSLITNKSLWPRTSGTKSKAEIVFLFVRCFCCRCCSHCVWYIYTPIVCDIYTLQLCVIYIHPNCVWYIYTPIVCDIYTLQLCVIYIRSNCVWYIYTPIVCDIYTLQLCVIYIHSNCVWYIYTVPKVKHH